MLKADGHQVDYVDDDLVTNLLHQCELWQRIAVKRYRRGLAELMRTEEGAKAWPSADTEEHAVEIRNAHDWRRPASGQRGGANTALAIAVVEQGGQVRKG